MKKVIFLIAILAAACTLEMNTEARWRGRGHWRGHHYGWRRPYWYDPYYYRPYYDRPYFGFGIGF